MQSLVIVSNELSQNNITKSDSYGLHYQTILNHHDVEKLYP